MVTFMTLYDLTGNPYTLDTVGMRLIDRQGDVVGEGPPGYAQRSTNVSRIEFSYLRLFIYYNNRSI
jgi:hypothetical protein